MSTTWIEASAGTGKTFTLVQRVLELIRSNLPVDRILMVTFTDRATAELKTRIREGLRHEAKTTQDPRFAQALEDLNALTITTIHGFCRALLTQFPLESGVSFEPELVDQGSQWRRLLREELRTRLSQLDPELLAWADLEDEEALLAMAQSALERGVFTLPLLHPDPEDQARFRALITQWQSHSGPFWDAVEGLRQVTLAVDSAQAFGAEGERVLHARNHRTPYRLVRELSLVTHPRDWDPLFREDALQTLERWDEGGSVWKKAARPPFEGTLEAVRTAALAFAAAARAVESALAPGVGLQAFLRGTARHQVLESVCLPVLARRSARELTFHDLIDRVRSLVTGPDGGPLIAAAAGRWKAVLIDEFQDTDPSQWAIFSSLFLDAAHDLVLVGDPKQSIYRFRGADLALYRTVRRQLQSQGADVRVLQKNFRSTAAMIQAVNQRFDPDRGAGWEEPEDFSASEKGDKAIAALVHHQAGAVVPVPPVVVWSGTDEGLWHQHLVETVLDLLDGTKFLDDGTQPPVPLTPGDILILVRKKREAWQLHRQLTRRGLPAVVGGAGGLLKTREAQEVLLFLKALESPRSVTATRALGWTRLFSGAAVEDLAGALDGARKDQEKGSYLQAFRRVAAALEPGVVDGGGLDRVLALPGGARVVTNVEHVLELVQERWHRGDFPEGRAALALETWIQSGLDEDEVDLRRDGEAKSIRLMTIHAAKGLEAPVVLHGFPSQSRPHRGPWIITDGVDFLGTAESQDAEARNRAAEDLRLTYVAWTRARTHQVLVDPDSTNPSFPVREGPPRPWVEAGRRRLTLTLEPPIPGLEHRHPWVESHSGLWRRATRDDGDARTVWDRPSGPRDQESGSAPEPTLGEALPAGPSFGDLVHDILEVLDFQQWAPGASGDQRAENDRTVEEHCRRRRGEFGGRDLTRSLTPWFHGVLSAPLALGPGVNPVTFTSLGPGDTRRELEFHLPLHAQAGRFLWGGREFVIHSGYLTGRIDLLFRWEGRLYLADWKTNRWGPDTSLEDLMAEAGYDLQAQWYWEALKHLCQVQQEPLVPGGVLYVFLRGPDDKPRGVFLSPEHLNSVPILGAFLSEVSRG